GSVGGAVGVRSETVACVAGGLAAAASPLATARKLFEQFLQRIGWDSHSAGIRSRWRQLGQRTLTTDGMFESQTIRPFWRSDGPDRSAEAARLHDKERPTWGATRSFLRMNDRAAVASRGRGFVALRILAFRG